MIQNFFYQTKISRFLSDKSIPPIYQTLCQDIRLCIHRGILQMRDTQRTVLEVWMIELRNIIELKKKTSHPKISSQKYHQSS